MDNINIIQKRTVKRGFKKSIYGLILMIIDFFILTSLHHIPKISIFDKADPYLIFISSGILIVIYIFKKMYYFESYLFWDELVNIIHSVTIYFFIILLLVIVRKNYIDLFKLFVISIFFIIIDSIVRYMYRKLLKKFDLLKTNVIILGTGELAQVVYDKIKEHPFTMYNFLGFLKTEFDKNNIVNENQVLGYIDEINTLISNNEVEEILIAIPNLSKKELSNIVAKLERNVRKIKYIPDLYGLMSFSTQIQDLDGILAITAVQELLNPLNLLIKRIFDIVLSTIGIILASPIFLIIAILIKKEDGGPVFFKHKRIGKDLKEFEMYKFRSMYPDAEKRLQELLDSDEKIREEWFKHFKLKNDPRITKIGKFLRKTSLDELPQLFNVLKGDMSLVGPRPVVRKEVELYYGEEVAKEVFSIKPGITGMWQANGRSDVEDYSERIALDLYYLRNWSLELDFVILLKTIKIVIDKKGAY